MPRIRWVSWLKQQLKTTMIKKYKEFLNELFDSKPYTWKVNETDKDYTLFEFTSPKSKTTYEVVFERMPHSLIGHYSIIKELVSKNDTVVAITFTTKDSYDYYEMTNNNEITQLVVTIADMAKWYINEYNPDFFLFSGTKTNDEDGNRRNNIYLAFVKKIAKQLNLKYTFDEEDVLIKIKNNDD